MKQAFLLVLCALFLGLAPLPAQDPEQPAQPAQPAQIIPDVAPAPAAESPANVPDEAAKTPAVTESGADVLQLAGVELSGQRRQLPDPLPANGKVMIIPLQGAFDKVLLFNMRLAFQSAAEDKDVVAVVIDMDTPGGELGVTKEVMDWILAAKVPVYIYINRWAGSAGAIVSFAADGIYMHPSGSIGAATPIMMTPEGPTTGDENVNEKFSSFTRSMARAVAEQKGYYPELAEAMIDRSLEVRVGDRVISKEGKILTLSAKQAHEIIPPLTRPLLADGISDDLEAMLKDAKLDSLARVDFEIQGGAKLAGWILAITPLLLTAGIMGIITEFKTPGFGFPGVAGIICIGLVLFGTYFAGLSGLTEALLILLGIILLIVELFLIPGFGIFGISGIISIVMGIILALIPALPDVPEIEGWDPTLTLDNFLNSAMLTMLWTVMGIVVGLYLLSKFLPKTELYGRLVMAHEARSAEGYVGVDVVANKSLVGHHGKALTDLRPAGTAIIDGKRVDVVSEGDYIDAGQPIVVVSTNGPRLAVALAPDDEA